MEGVSLHDHIGRDGPNQMKQEELEEYSVDGKPVVSSNRFGTEY